MSTASKKKWRERQKANAKRDLSKSELEEDLTRLVQAKIAVCFAYRELAELSDEWRWMGHSVEPAGKLLEVMGDLDGLVYDSVNRDNNPEYKFKTGRVKLT